MRKSDKVKNMAKVNETLSKRFSLLKEGAIDNKFSNKKSIVNAILKILNTEGVEGRYTDEHWAGISKLTTAFNKYGIEYELQSANYEHRNDFKTTLPNIKVYVFNVTVMDKMGKQHILPLKVNCAFVGKTGTSEDGTYELTYYFMV
jgi:hypothetical protein